MKHCLRHDGYCSCGGVPIYVGDPPDMIMCRISTEALQGERARQRLWELREGRPHISYTPEWLQRRAEEWRVRELEKLHGTDFAFAKESAEGNMALIASLMQRFHAAERLSEEEAEEIRMEICELPLWIHIPGEPRDPCHPDADAGPSEADERNAVIIDLSGRNDPCVRVILAPTGDTTLQYSYWRVPWTALSLSSQQQYYLDNFGAEFAWMRTTFGDGQEPTPVSDEALCKS